MKMTTQNAALSRAKHGMKTVITAIIFSAIAVACGSPLGVEPTLRPTYTPYPNTVAVDGNPKMHEVGAEEWFIGEAWMAFEKGEEMYDSGLCESAIIAFKEAQEHHGKQSDVLENRIGLSYDCLGNYDLAIQHHSYAIAINDDSVNRVNRGISYLENGRCEPAITDAKTALAMAPAQDEGYHTDVEANTILATCYMLQDENLLALQHADAALTLASESNYTATDIAAIAEIRSLVQLGINR